MFMPYFIAILLGLISPSEQSNPNCHNNTQVVSTQDNGGNGDNGDDGDNGEDGDGTGGETGQIYPPK